MVVEEVVVLGDFLGSFATEKGKHRILTESSALLEVPVQLISLCYLRHLLCRCYHLSDSLDREKVGSAKNLALPDLKLGDLVRQSAVIELQSLEQLMIQKKTTAEEVLLDSETVGQPGRQVGVLKCWEFDSLGNHHCSCQ